MAVAALEGAVEALIESVRQEGEVAANHATYLVGIATKANSRKSTILLTTSQLMTLGKYELPTDLEGKFVQASYRNDKLIGLEPASPEWEA
jgi:hypothetical protein